MSYLSNAAAGRSVERTILQLGDGQGSVDRWATRLSLELLTIYSIQRVVLIGELRGERAALDEILLKMSNGAKAEPQRPPVAVVRKKGVDRRLILRLKTAVSADRISVTVPHDLMDIETVRVMVPGEAHDVLALWQRSGLDMGRTGRSRTFVAPGGRVPSDQRRHTGCEAPADRRDRGRPHRATGEPFIATVHAVWLARRFLLDSVRVSHGAIFEMPRERWIGGIGFQSNSAPSGDTKYLVCRCYHMLAGSLFDGFTASDFAHIVRAHIQPLVFAWRHVEDLAQPDEIVVHMRAGDIFFQPPTHHEYVQPPLSYYQHIITKLLDGGEARRVRLVYESETNPCVGWLQDWMRAQAIPFAAQSRSQREDFTVLASARNLVMGYGSFGLAALAMSGTVDTVHAFRMKPEWATGLVKTYIQYDTGPDYIAPKNWTADPQQLALMQTYPGERLRIVDEFDDPFGSQYKSWTLEPS